MIYFAFWNLKDTLIAGFLGLMLALDAFIYEFIISLYKLFLVISSAQILQAKQYEHFAEKINVIVGVAMLFVVAFSILQSIVNPDNIEKATSKIAVNIIISLISLALVSTAFNFAYQLQEKITEQNIIGKIILGGYKTDKKIVVYDDEGVAVDTITQDSVSTLKMAGNEIAVSVFRAFLYDTTAEVTRIGNEQKEGAYRGYPLGDDYESIIKIKEDPLNKYEDFYFITNINYLDDIHQFAMLTGSFDLYPPLGNILNTHQSIKYKFIFSTVAAIFVCYILISFCIDIAVRSFKLAFFQLIAPIPILARIVPAGNDMFNRWFKAVISTFLDIFVKISILFFGVYLIQLIQLISEIDWFNWFNENLYSGVDNATILFGHVFMIIGILLFVKQAPQLIKDVFGIKEGSLAFGIGKKLGELKETPIIGKAIDKGSKFAKESFNKGRGFATGALGGAMTGLRQGGIKGMGAGLAYGALEGGKAGGKQFKAQRNAELQRVTGNPDAKAGFFGGQKFRYDRFKANRKAQGQAAYQARMGERLGDDTGRTADEKYDFDVQKAQDSILTQKKDQYNSETFDPMRSDIKNQYNSKTTETIEKYENKKKDTKESIDSKYTEEKNKIDSYDFLNEYIEKDIEERINNNSVFADERKSIMDNVTDENNKAEMLAMLDERINREKLKEKQYYMENKEKYIEANEEAVNNEKIKRLEELDQRMKEEIEKTAQNLDQELASELSELEKNKDFALGQVQQKLEDKLMSEMAEINETATKQVEEAYKTSSAGTTYLNNKKANHKAKEIKNIQEAIQNIIKEENKKNPPPSENNKEK